MTQTLEEKFFDDSELGDEKTFDEISDNVTIRSTPVEDWEFVHARVWNRGSPLYSDSLCKVVSKYSFDPLVEENSVERITIDELIERMPDKHNISSKAVPSPSGNYISVFEVYGSEKSDGTVIPETKAKSTIIPIELVFEKVSYDKAITLLIDEKL